ARPAARAAHHALRAYAHRGSPAAPAARGGRSRPHRRRGHRRSGHARRRAKHAGERPRPGSPGPPGTSRRAGIVTNREGRLDVVGVGNALVDVLSHESHDFVTAQALTPGAMTLIDTERAESLYTAMGPAVEISGGSAANTLVGVASLGGTAA